jgi:hypothetical protein
MLDVDVEGLMLALLGFDLADSFLVFCSSLLE